MRRASIVLFAAGALLATSMPGIASAAEREGGAAATRQQLVQRCIKQANHQLAGTGRALKRSQFDKVFLGTPGDDTLAGRTDGRDLICGFAGNDRTHDDPASFLGVGDAFVGGAGDDDVHRLKGGIFVGSNGEDEVATLRWGAFVGGDGADSAGTQHGGWFYGRDGRDALASLQGGTFVGGNGADSLGTMDDGYWIGGNGPDTVNQVSSARLLRGGAGDDRITDLQSGLFQAGPGDDHVQHVRGRYEGGPGRDTAGQVHKGAAFVGGRERDTVGTVHGRFYGARGPDKVQELDGGRYFGGPGRDRLDTCSSGQAIAVEAGDVPCPAP